MVNLALSISNLLPPPRQAPIVFHFSCLNILMTEATVLEVSRLQRYLLEKPVAANSSCDSLLRTQSSVEDTLSFEIFARFSAVRRSMSHKHPDEMPASERERELAILLHLLIASRR